MTSVTDIQHRVAASFGLPVIDMRSDRRAPIIARPRQIAIYLARNLTPCSHRKIGELFGNRDKTTVRNAIRRVTDLMAENDDFRRRVIELADQLQCEAEEM